MIYEAGKGSKQRPTNALNYAINFDKIFGNKYNKNMPEYCEYCEAPCTGDCKETCPYCGILTNNACDSPPPDICDQAINVTYGSPV
jgi:hypothetical protein